MSDLTVAEARRLARAQRAAVDAARCSDPAVAAQARAELDEIRHELFEGDDE